MEGSRLLRFSRIAVTTLSLTACALLAALWVRSYHEEPWLRVPSNNLDRWKYIDKSEVKRMYQLTSWNGAILVATTTVDPSTNRWSVSYPGKNQTLLGFGVRRNGPMRSAKLPYWFLVFLSATTAVIPWLSWSNRISLRTLLIATTLVAVGLGVAVYLAR
jgi:hypothetical protein